jgi:hypothetical protein
MRSPKRQQKQKGGAVLMPSEYFGKDSGRYFAEGSPELTIGNSAYGANLPTSRGMLIQNDLMGPQLGPTSHSGLQTGGQRKRQQKPKQKQTGGAFDYIVNPETNRKVSVYSTLGRKIIKNYIASI